jgi:hypothetical protein
MSGQRPFQNTLKPSKTQHGEKKRRRKKEAVSILSASELVNVRPPLKPISGRFL